MQYFNAISQNVSSVFEVILPKKKKCIFLFYIFVFVFQINNPFKTLRVLEPGQDDGCSVNATATVAETARHSKCLVGMNGGMFNITTFQCLG